MGFQASSEPQTKSQEQEQQEGIVQSIGVENKRLGALKKQYEPEQERLKTEIKNWGTSVKQLEGDVKELGGKKKTLTTDIKSLKIKKENAKKDTKKIVGEKQEEIEAIDANLVIKEEEQAIANTNLSKTTQDVKDGETRLKELKTLEGQAQGAMDNKDVEKEGIEADIVTIKKNKDDLEEKNKKLEERNEELTNAFLLEMKEKHGDVIDQYDRAKEDLETAKTEKAQVEDDADTAKKNREKDEKASATATKELSDKQKKVDDDTETYKILKTEVDKRLKGLSRDAKGEAVNKFLSSLEGDSVVK